MTSLLQLDNVTRRYRVRQPGGMFSRAATLKAVDGVSFSIPAGKTLGLVGESGCGKSTTARLALGLTPATSGAVIFDSAPVIAGKDERWRRQRRQMQLVFQDPLGALDQRLPVGRQIAEPLAIHSVGGPSERRDRALRLLDAVGLSEHLFGRYPHELSGGQRQRVVLARALILEPKLIACDEPISALDVSIQAQIIDLLLDLQASHGVAYLFISHDLRVVRQVSHEVAVMYLGRIVEQGLPDRLFHQPEHPYTRALVSAIPRTRRGGTRERLLLAGDPPNPVDRPSGCAFHPRCPWVQPLCRAESPALAPLGDGHRVACHRAQGAIPQVA